MIDEDVGIAGFDQALAKTIGILRRCKGCVVIALDQREDGMHAVTEMLWPIGKEDSLRSLLLNLLESL